LAEQFVPQTTAGIFPEKFAEHLFFARDPRVAAVILSVFLLVGFGLRMSHLGAESLGEDELNKLQTVEEYRANGLSGKNGEHPFLMKGMQTLSIAASEKLNSLNTNISEEAALRFPVALFGTFSVLLIFLLVSQLFGRSIGLICAIFWAVEPMAIGFDRIAKEDSLVVFFFLLTNLFWIKSQTLAERGSPGWLKYVWLTGAGFAALMASKYYPHLLGVTAGYYILFQQLPGNKWALGPKRWLRFILIMGLAFLIFNPTVLLPDTWREMLKFSSENRIGHAGYEFMGQVYSHKVTAWLSGIPWTFYYVFIAVKTSLSTLVLLLIGLPLMFKRKLGDGRFFIAIWAFFWFMPFSVLGGKFTRYFTIVEPLILIVAAVGAYFLLRWVSERFAEGNVLRPAVQLAGVLVVAAIPLTNSLSSVPHYRLFTNSIGTALASTGWYFPHDEFYDASTRDIMSSLTQNAVPNAVVACETPTLFEYYARKAGREDLRFVSMSDKTKVQELRAGDYIVAVRGRRYFSNDTILKLLERSKANATEIKIGEIPSATIYKLDAETLAEILALNAQ
jgi:hypothetical protein